MSTQKILKLDLVVYPCNVYIAINCENETLTHEFKEEFKDLDSKLAAACYTLKSGDILLRFRDQESFTSQIISHEAVHAAFYIFDYLGIKIDPDNQEPFAFLVDCIVGFCEKHKV